MKEPIEELFKESLKGREMPYNPKAWEAMSARLDAVKPVAKPASNLKYYLGAAAIGAVAVATYFIFAGGDTPENTKNPVAKQETTLEQTTTGTTKPSSGNSEAQTGDASVISNPDETPSSADERLQGSSVEQLNSNTHTNHTAQSNSENSRQTNLNISTTETNSNNPNGTNGSSNTTNLVNEESTTTSSKITLPAVADLCLNEETVITNDNDRPLYILDAVNDVVGTVPASKAVVFKPEVVGNYSIGYKQDGNMETGSNFVVNRVPDAHFTVDLVNKYENGLPATRVEAIGGQGTYVWTAEKQSSTGVQTDLRFFEKGSHTIKLTVDNGQCLSSFEKTIYVEEDYNLMAVNGFTPSSPIPSNQTFIPFALTQRPDANFELTILDARDGGTVYRTTDASLPWDGTDMRSGRRSETTQVYIWKVVIMNPEANEPREYRGTITMNIAN
jgi:hypothetical protein